MVQGILLKKYSIGLMMYLAMDIIYTGTMAQKDLVLDSETQKMQSILNYGGFRHFDK